MQSGQKKFFRADRPLALALGLVLFAQAEASTTDTVSWSGNVSVDAATDVAVATLPTTLASGSIVSDVTVSVTWRKTDGSCTSPGTGNSYHNETGMKLQAPDGTKVRIVNTGQYSGSLSTGDVTTDFSDAHLAGPPSGAPSSGSFRPYHALSGFDGVEASGSWTFLATDNAWADPLCIKGITLTVTAEDPVVADAGGPYTVDEGGSPILTSASTGGTITSVEWDCTNDGTWDATGDTTTACVYPDEGTFTVAVRATNDVGSVDTATATVTVVNVGPTIDTTTIVGGDEGSELGFSATGSDAGGDDLTWSWDFGDGGTATGTDVVHTYADDGDYVVTVTTDDGDGGSASWTETITISNVDPVIDSMTLPGAIEGLGVQLSATGSDAGDDELVYTWSVDGQSLTGADVTVVLPDDGSYPVTLTVTDGDGGEATLSGTLVAANANPVVVSFDDVAGDEATSVTLQAEVTDVAADTLSYTWDLGDGQVMTTTEPELDYTWADDGDYVVTFTVTDEDGGQTVQTADVTIANVAPTVDTITLPPSVEEGSAASLAVTVSDASADDTPSVSWDFGDENTGSGASVSHTWADDGDFTVVVTVSDEDGGSYSESHTVTVDNVAPAFTNAAGLSAFEADAYSFLPTVDDPGDDELTFALLDMPDGAEIDEETGEVTWTPTYDQAAAGSADFEIEVDDGDGGTDTLAWTVTISHLDSDGDGMADQWETDNGFDPDDASDATGDDDGDGRDNLLEFELGTDPSSFDGPEAPVLVSPKDDVEVLEASPTLTWTNAEHPLADDVLTYDVEVYEDDTLTVLLTDATDVAEADLQSTWWVDVALPENAMPVWRVRAVDPYVEGPWSETGRFFLNAEDEAPPIPELLFPIEGEILAMEAPALQIGTVIDPDGDAVTYDLELVDEADNLLASILDVTADAEATDLMWDVSPELFVEDGLYKWRALARDEDGMDAGWSEWTWFRYSMEDAAPEAPMWLTPENDSMVESLRPEVIVSGVTDPEGSGITYHAELSSSADYAVIGVRGSAFDETGAVEDIALELDKDLVEHFTWHGRVRAEDESGIASPWTSVSFFVRGPNDAPTVPVPLSPVDTALQIGEPWPELMFTASSDPEGDEVTYEVRVLATAGSVLVETGGLDIQGFEGSWDPQLTTELGAFAWQVRAVDALGAASDWSEPAEVLVGDPDENAVSDCGCSSTGGGAGWLWLGGLGLMGLRRRQRR